MKKKSRKTLRKLLETVSQLTAELESGMMDIDAADLGTADIFFDEYGINIGFRNGEVTVEDFAVLPTDKMISSMVDDYSLDDPEDFMAAVKKLREIGLIFSIAANNLELKGVTK